MITGFEEAFTMFPCNEQRVSSSNERPFQGLITPFCSIYRLLQVMKYSPGVDEEEQDINKTVWWITISPFLLSSSSFLYRCEIAWSLRRRRDKINCLLSLSTAKKMRDVINLVCRRFKHKNTFGVICWRPRSGDFSLIYLACMSG